MEIIEQFRAALAMRGLRPPDIAPDGRDRRCAVDGDKGSKKSGWFVMFADGLGGMFENHKDGCGLGHWQAERAQEWTAAERAAHARHVEAARAARMAAEGERHASARKRAASLWASASDRPKARHAYLVAKGVRAYGLRQLRSQLLIPVRDAAGELHGLQFIGEDGSKKFLTGTAKAGHYGPIGSAPKPGEWLAVAEGYATGATVRELTGWPVAVAFDCGNLRAVAEALRAKLPEARIVIAADNDHGTEGNPGLSAAREAAQAIGGIVAAPEFVPGDKGTDWNDYAAARGAQTARDALIRASETPAQATEDAGAQGAVASAGDDGNEDPTPKAAKQRKKPANLAGSGPRFEVNDRGLYWHGVDRENGAQAPQRIGPPIHVRARLRDEAESNWGLLVEFADAGGTLHRWGLPARLLVNREEVIGELLRQGYVFGATNDKKTMLLNYLGWPVSLPLARSVERTGWHGDVYVLPDRVIGESAEPVYFQAESLQGNVYQARGELADWRSDLAELCRGNSRLLFAVSAAFASVLLGFADEESGGFHFRGGSSSGKTTALRVAASVFGGPDYLCRWRATDNALEAVAALRNDALLILDELAQVDPKAAGAAAYMLGNGEGKQRAYKTGSARPVLRWRLLYLSAGEISLAEHMRADGQRAQAGQEARLAEIPADAGASRGLFEDLRGYADGAALSRALLAAAGASYGTAGPAFIAALLLRLAELPGRLCRARERFLSRALPPGADGQAHRVAGRFALVAEAGELASELHITGWESGEAEAAAITCFRAWLDQRGGAGNLEPRRMLDQVRYFLERHGEARFQPWELSDKDKSKWTISNRAGFRVGGEAGLMNQDRPEITYYVLREVFREEVCAGLDHREVLRALDAASAIKRDKASRKLHRRERLPGLGLTPCYVILPGIWADPDDDQGAVSPAKREQRATEPAGTAGTAGTDLEAP